MRNPLRITHDTFVDRWLAGSREHQDALRIVGYALLVVTLLEASWYVVAVGLTGAVLVSTASYATGYEQGRDDEWNEHA